MKRKKGYYSISVVAKMFSVHQQTIRMYEKEGLITPRRSTGNTRLFSEEDVDRLEEIINLTHKMGVNLAGVEIVLKLQKKIKHLQTDMNKLFSQLHGQLEGDTDKYKGDIKQHAERLVEIKKENFEKSGKRAGGQHEDVIDVTEKIDETKDEKRGKAVNTDDWEVDYENDE